MSKIYKDLTIISISTIFITFLVWFPHIFGFDSFFKLNFSAGFNNIYRNFDGLEYVVIAKTFYDPEILKTIPQSLEASYYPAHFPLYSILILIFAPILGFLKSMLFVSLLFTILSAIAFYFFVSKLKLTDHPLLLSIVFLILPARWLIVHTVGSSEPVFIFFIITTLYFFIRFKQTSHTSDIYLSSLAGSLAILTRPPGVLLALSLALFVIWEIFTKKISFQKALTSFYPLTLLPLTLILIFYYFQITLGDFWAYFHTGDNIHLFFPPFQIFNKDEFWVGDIWLEDIIYIFIITLFGGLTLIKQKLYPLAFFVLTFFTASIFIAHRDISRYLLPVFPFILIAFEKTLTSKEFRIVLIVLALGIYLYTQNFIIANVAPYPNPNLFN